MSIILILFTSRIVEFGPSLPHIPILKRTVVNVRGTYEPLCFHFMLRITYDPRAIATKLMHHVIGIGLSQGCSGIAYSQIWWETPSAATPQLH
jgi:hypothetical protein